MEKTDYLVFLESLTRCHQEMVISVMNYFMTQDVKSDMDGYKHVSDYVSEWKHFFCIGDNPHERYFVAKCEYWWNEDVLARKVEYVMEFASKQDYTLYRHKLNVKHAHKTVLN